MSSRIERLHRLRGHRIRLARGRKRVYAVSPKPLVPLPAHDDDRFAVFDLDVETARRPVKKRAVILDKKRTAQGRTILRVRQNDKSPKWMQMGSVDRDTVRRYLSKENRRRRVIQFNVGGASPSLSPSESDVTMEQAQEQEQEQGQGQAAPHPTTDAFQQRLQLIEGAHAKAASQEKRVGRVYSAVTNKLRKALLKSDLDVAILAAEIGVQTGLLQRWISFDPALDDEARRAMDAMIEEWSLRQPESPIKPKQREQQHQPTPPSSPPEPKPGYSLGLDKTPKQIAEAQAQEAERQYWKHRYRHTPLEHVRDVKLLLTKWRKELHMDD